MQITAFISYVRGKSHLRVCKLLKGTSYQFFLSEKIPTLTLFSLIITITIIKYSMNVSGLQNKTV